MFTIPQNTFEPHPMGRHTGIIVDIQDEGMQDTQWGRKHKISIRIDSDKALTSSGDPASMVVWYTLSSAPKSNLRKFREAVLDRLLTREEEINFDAQAELVGRRISYRIDHQDKQDGTMRAVIRDGSVEPAKEESGSEGNATSPAHPSDPGSGDDSSSKTLSEDLPF